MAKSKLRENVETILYAILIALLVRIFIIEAYKIPTGSMIPTLIEGDHLLVNKFIYGVKLPIVGWKLPAFTSPKRGDIVVFYYPRYVSPGVLPEIIDLLTFGVFGLTNTEASPRNFIKRTIGTPGDIITIKGQKLVINGEAQTQKMSLKQEIMKDILAIDNPAKYHDPIDGGKGEKYYSIKIDGQIKGRGNRKEHKEEIVLTEITGHAEHAIQVTDLEKTGNPDYKDISFLYIPKKGDQIQLKRHESDQYHFIINGKIAGVIDRYIYHRFYEKILPDPEIKDDSPSITLDSDYYFMMGDNRDNSDDSRGWGFVNEQYIIGTPIVIYLPFDRFGMSPD